MVEPSKSTGRSLGFGRGRSRSHQQQQTSPIGQLAGAVSPSNPKNRAIRQTRFTAPALQFVNRALDQAITPPRPKVNGAEKCFNFTYKEPLVQPTPSEPPTVAKQTLGPGQHLLDPAASGQLDYAEAFYAKEKSDKFLHMLLGSLNFKGLRRRRDEEPTRMCVWFGPTDTPYSHSYASLQNYEFANNRIIAGIKADMEARAGCPFNSCLVTLYRHNKDHLPWHAADEASLGESPVIAMVSLGETRRLLLGRKGGGAEYEVHLTHGSVLLMKGDLLERWQYSVPVEYHDRKSRIELTFRFIRDTE